ncbi:MAG: DNA-processing protein DprA [Crocinitomicaceae bacterium]|nr:DNA-processing protein DprA [Crocinitomicaceae bacterium]
MKESTIYEIGLSLLDKIGPKRAKRLLSEIGSAEGIFKEKKEHLGKIDFIGQAIIDSINFEKALIEAEQEMEFIQKQNIHPIFFLDRAYPNRLKYCDDGPIMLYGKGKLNLNPPKSVAIVGTRNASTYGLDLVEKLIQSFSGMNILVVSGLAFGIDIKAHRECLKNKVPTVAVLGSSLDWVYPPEHTSTLDSMLENGGVLSEFTSGSKPDAQNFPKRNRIVAGMTHATIVIESKEKGGSIITAELANDYNSEVFAFPGNVTQPFSRGTNKLIQENKAQLIQSPDDFLRFMSWGKNESPQMTLFDDLSEEENKIITLLRPGKMHVDLLKHELRELKNLNILLLQLEMKGIVKSRPGSFFEL